MKYDFFLVIMLHILVAKPQPLESNTCAITCDSAACNGEKLK